MTLSLPDRGDGTLSSKALEKILEFLSEKADILAIGREFLLLLTPKNLSKNFY